MSSIETISKRVEKLESRKKKGFEVVYLDDEGKPIGAVPEGKDVIYLPAHDLLML